MNHVYLLDQNYIEKIEYLPCEGKAISIIAQQSKPDIILNANLFSLSNSKPVNGVMHNGIWLTTKPNPAMYGVHIEKNKYNRKYSSNVNSGSFLANYGELVIDGKQQTNLTWDSTLTGKSQRTAIGWFADSTFIIYVGEDKITANELAKRMYQLGCYYAMNLDGGLSSQIIGPHGNITTSRKCSGYIGIWLNKTYYGRIYSMKYHSNIKLAPNFKVSEFACKDGNDLVYLDARLPNVLQSIRDINGTRAVSITSAYRTKSHNTKVGGSTSSYHLTGSAADIKVASTSTETVCKCAEKALAANSISTGGIIRYVEENFVHVDVRPNKYRGLKQTKSGSIVSVSGWAGVNDHRPVLKIGSKGEHVTYLQKRLNQYGALPQLNVDAKYGDKTKRAVLAFQYKNSLAATGEVDSKTWDKIN